jgi:TonB family protein
MRQTTISLIALFLIGVSIGQASAQEPGQKSPVPATTSETEQPKTPVEQAAEEARERGETVLTVCIDNCSDESKADDPPDFERGRVIRLPKPTYPAIAAAAHASGEVRVQVMLGHDGTVIAAYALSGHPLLQAASVKAARESLFTPTKLDGKPVKVVGVIVYNFVSQ